MKSTRVIINCSIELRSYARIKSEVKAKKFETIGKAVGHYVRKAMADKTKNDLSFDDIEYMLMVLNGLPESTRTRCFDVFHPMCPLAEKKWLLKTLEKTKKPWETLIKYKELKIETT